MTRFKNSSDISHYRFINPHDRMYRDCLKNVEWDKPSIFSYIRWGFMLLGVFFGVGLVLLLLSY